MSIYQKKKCHLIYKNIPCLAWVNKPPGFKASRGKGTTNRNTKQLKLSSKEELNYMLVRLQRSKQSKQTSKKLTAFPEGRTVSFLNTNLNFKSQIFEK